MPTDIAIVLLIVAALVLMAWINERRKPKYYWRPPSDLDATEHFMTNWPDEYEIDKYTGLPIRKDRTDEG